jgi:hypothetical protein
MTGARRGAGPRFKLGRPGRADKSLIGRAVADSRVVVLVRKRRTPFGAAGRGGFMAGETLIDP